MATQGTAILDFGAFPGASDASVAVTGQAGIVAGSLVEAWISLSASADHSADEHLVEEIEIFAGNISAGTGFTIYGICRSASVEPDSARSRVTTLKEPRLYGKFNINWVWN
jgi:hypothetical protein